MGISICLSISKSVTREEWERVYEETLTLVDAFPLAERRKVPVRGIETICLVRSREREITYGWHNELVKTGWIVDGHYDYLRVAEEYSLLRNLVIDERYEYEADAPDAIMGSFPGYLDYNWDDPQCTHAYDLWGAKTQGEPHHLYLLAIACLVEARLGSKAFVYGDITRGQCRRAVKIANSILEKKITEPDRCGAERLLKRLDKLPVSEKEKMAAAVCYYLGEKDADFGAALRANYPEEVCDAYWKERFTYRPVGTLGFSMILQEYLRLGFGLEKLCGYVPFRDEEGELHYEEFLKEIMDAGLHLKQKDCRDILRQDPEEEHPGDVSTQFARAFFAGARNRKVDRYIPAGEIRAVLKRQIGGYCDVDGFMDDYLAKEAARPEMKNPREMSDDEFRQAFSADASAVFQEVMEQRQKDLQEAYAQYDVSDSEDLLYYEKGDTVHPKLLEQTEKYYAFYKDVAKESRFAELMALTPEERCHWLVEKNTNILIRDKGWEKIFNDIVEHEDSFARYYPMMRVKIETETVLNVVRAIVLNDDIYRMWDEGVKRSGKR